MSYNTAKSMMNSTIGHIQSVDQENAKRFYDETTTSNMINQQKSSLINNMAGASLGSFGGGIQTVRSTIKRVKQLKNKLNIGKNVKRLMGNKEETNEPVSNEDFFSFGGIDETNDKPITQSNIQPEAQMESKQNNTAADFFSESKQETPSFNEDEMDSKVNALMDKYPELNLDKEMKIAQFKLDNKSKLVNMNEGEQQEFISSGVDDKPDNYPSNFGASSQPERGVGAEIEMSEMNQIPEHAYERSSDEIMRTGYGDPRSYNSEFNDVSLTKPGTQNAPEATAEMKDVINSAGEKVGMSEEGADLSQPVETIGSSIGNKISSGIDSAAQLGSEGLDFGITASLETADVALNALDVIPVLGEITGAVSLIAGIGLTIGSSIFSGEKAQQQQASAENTYNTQLNQASNYAGKFTSNTFSSQYDFQ